MRYAFSNVFEDPFWISTIPMALVGWIVALVGSILNNAANSSQFPVFSWWGVAFEMVSIVLILHAAFSNEIRMYRTAIVGCLALATVYTTNSTNNFVWRDNSSSSAAAAGNILLSIINILWILYFGTAQDEPVHMYIDSFAGYKKMSLSKFQKKAREKRQRRSTPSALRSGTGHSHAGRESMVEPQRLSRPYRMSDMLQNINIGGPTNFHMQTNPNDPANPRPLPDQRASAALPYNPLNSTYLYSVDQLHRHGLSSHEVETESQRNSKLPPERASVAVTEDEDLFENMEPVARARARFSYDARTSDGEIPFKEGEVLEVCDMTGNWWYCRRDNGDIGICPRNYLELIGESS